MGKATDVRVVGTTLHSPFEEALPFGQGGIESLPGDYKGGWKSPLSCPLVAGASRGILPGCRGERVATRSMTARPT